MPMQMKFRPCGDLVSNWHYPALFEGHLNCGNQGLRISSRYFGDARSISQTALRRANHGNTRRHRCQQPPRPMLDESGEHDHRRTFQPV